MKDYKQSEEQILKSVLHFSLGSSIQNPKWSQTHSYRRSQALALDSSLQTFQCASLVLIIISAVCMNRGYICTW